MSIFGSNKEKKDKDLQPGEDQLHTNDALGETSIREEEGRANRKYQDLLDQLYREKHENAAQYGQRIARIRQDEQYKEDLLQSKLNTLSAQKTEQEQALQERLTQIQSKHAAQEQLYRERQAQLDQFERERTDAQQAHISALEQESQAEIRALEAQIERLQQELALKRKQYQERMAGVNTGSHYQEEAKQVRTELQKAWNDLQLQFEDELAHIQKEKARNDAEFEARLIPLREELSRAQGEIGEKIGHVEREQALQEQLIEDRIRQVEEERLHLERQEQLRMERENLASGYRERNQQLQQGTLCRMKDIEADYEVADRHQDVRGWSIIGQNAQKIGKVDELIVDTNVMKVRYLDVAVTGSLLPEGEPNRHLLLPVGVATLDYDHKAVLVPTLDTALALKIPAYRGEPISRDYERTLLTALSSDYTVGSDYDPNFYDRTDFDDSRFYGNRDR